MSTPKIEIILVKYNAPAFERKAIEAILAATSYPNYSLTAYQTERGVHLSKVWNRLIAASDAEYICLLNTDTVVSPGWLGQMLECAQHFGAAAVVPSSNNVHMSQIETPGLLREEQDREIIWQFARRNYDQYWGMAEPNLITCSAMCVLFPRTVWEKVGGFDERFFLYGEDTDFFTRAAKLGPVVWDRAVYVHHYGGQSVARAVADDEFDYAAVREKAVSIYEQKHGREGLEALIKAEGK